VKKYLMKIISIILVSVTIILNVSHIVQAQSQKVTTDIFGNRWQLIDHNSEGFDGVKVVPLLTVGQQTIIDKSNGFPDGKWDLICSDSNGYIWIGGGNGLARFDPRNPDDGWRLFNTDFRYPGGLVKSIKPSYEGMINVQLKDDRWYEVDIDHLGNQNTREIDFDYQVCQSSWQKFAIMPYCNHDVFGVEFKKKIYIPGGQAPNGFPAVMTNFDRMMIYDTRKDFWSLTAPMSINRRYCNVGVLGRKVWVIGGYERKAKGEHATPTIEIYDPKTGEWESGPSLAYPCAQSVVGTINDRLYVVFSDENRTRSYAFSISENEDQWQEETPPPCPVAQTDGCVHNGHLFLVIPGVGLISYCPKTKVWQTDYKSIPGTKAPRAAAVADYKGEIWVISGTDIPDEKSVWSYSLKSRNWYQRPGLPHPTFWADGIQVGKKLYVFGGASYSSKHNRFVFSNKLWYYK
jgi:hypothetical protein